MGEVGAGMAPARAEDLFERSGVTPYLKDVTTLLLENRPEDPLGFVAAYFRWVARSGSSPVLRAHRFVRLARPGAQSFDDNLLAAYCALDPTAEREPASPRPPQVSVDAYARLVRLLCSDLPVDVARVVLSALGEAAREADALSFAQFRSGVICCCYFEDFFENCELLHAEICYQATKLRIEPRLFAAAVLTQLARGHTMAAGGDGLAALQAALRVQAGRGVRMEAFTRETFARAVFGAVYERAR
mmetsp:Transcript_39346/g.97451  ORF Transcript_39346/g.97451 Transcript_39346/m.97451 type:complete len:245 (-) Transcript_39346:30-764(-)